MENVVGFIPEVVENHHGHFLPSEEQVPLHLFCGIYPRELTAKPDGASNRNDCKLSFTTRRIVELHAAYMSSLPLCILR